MSGQLFGFVLFFKQKTAYEMRISDWSSDVCSSDLLGCSHVQGYIYGRPMDLDGVLALIGEGGGRVVAQGYQSAREPRRHILRRIEVTSGGYRYDANVRNIASGGEIGRAHV